MEEEDFVTTSLTTPSKEFRRAVYSIVDVNVGEEQTPQREAQAMLELSVCTSLASINSKKIKSFNN